MEASFFRKKTIACRIYVMCPMILLRFLNNILPKPIGCVICDFVCAMMAKVRINWLDNLEWPLPVKDLTLASDANGISLLKIPSQIEYKAKIHQTDWPDKCHSQSMN